MFRQWIASKKLQIWACVATILIQSNDIQCCFTILMEKHNAKLTHRSPEFLWIPLEIGLGRRKTHIFTVSFSKQSPALRPPGTALGRPHDPNLFTTEKQPASKIEMFDVRSPVKIHSKMGPVGKFMRIPGIAPQKMAQQNVLCLFSWIAICWCRLMVF